MPTQPLHILHCAFTHYFGGLEQAYLNMTEALIKGGHRVTALLQEDAPYIPEVQRHTSDIHSMRVRGFYDPIALLRLRALVKQVQPELIIAHNSRAVQMLVRATHGMGVRVLGVSHGHKLARMRSAHMLAVLTTAMADEFAEQGYPREHMVVLGNMIHLPASLHQKPREAELVIGTMGRLAPEKGITDFVEALALLHARGVPFRALIGGDGPQHEELLALTQSRGISDHVTFLGWVNDKASLYHQLDMCCIPSTYEPFGLVILEALAHGVPLVTTAVSGPLSIVTHEKNALVVPPANPAQLANALQRIATDSALAHRLSAEGWQRVQDFGMNAFVEKLNALVRKATHC
jgi:glycosyltransferase involved in cell wall biosynthesis